MPKKTNATRAVDYGTAAITGLIDKGTLQAMQDRFSERFMNVPTAILDHDANPMTYERCHSLFCQQIRKMSVGFELCRQCDRSVIAKVLRQDAPAGEYCIHGGLYDFAAPIRLAGRPVAFFFVGQLRDLDRGPKGPPLAVLKDALAKTAPSPKAVQAVDVADLEKKFGKVPVRSAEDIKRISAAAVAFADDLSCVLQKLSEWRRPDQVALFAARIMRTSNLEDLFRVCVSATPRLLGTKDCSILTTVGSSGGQSPRLVLQRTSHGPSRKFEKKKFYRPGVGLTGWVWKHAMPLRLDDITDKSELAKYPDLTWTRTVDDSENHKEWLGVPLVNWHGDVIGVLRVPEKREGRRSVGGGFSFEDEILLVALASVVARQMESLQMISRAGRALNACLDAGIRLSRATNEKAVQAISLAACVRIYGQSGRAFVFSSHAEESDELRIDRTHGTLVPKGVLGTHMPMNHSLSGKAFRRNHAFIVHDLNAARKRDEYMSVVTGLGCLMAAPLSFGDRRFGVLTVGADRLYGFVEEPDLHILRDLAEMAGAALARIKAIDDTQKAFATFAQRSGHTLSTRIATLENSIVDLNTGGPKMSSATRIALNDVVEFLKTSANRAIRFGGIGQKARSDEFNLTPILERLRRLRRGSMTHWRVQDSIPMVGDPELVEDIVVELIHNASRFVSRKRGWVKVRAFKSFTFGPRSRGAGTVVIEIEDNGKGVKEDEKEKVFAPYFTSDQSRLGLGLTIVKAAAEAMNGYVVECGRSGRGALFRVILPQP